MTTESAESCPLPPATSSRAIRPPAPAWMRWTLKLAGIYNMTWGTAVILWPNQPFEWLGMQPLNHPEIWQCLGMVLGLYGLGYWIAARDPARHWAIVFVGWLGKVLGPVGLLVAAGSGKLPWSFGLVNLPNDLIWWIPFTAILYYAWRTNSEPAGGRPLTLAEAMTVGQSHYGRTLADMSHERTVLVVFLRHAGCTFCRQALADLAVVRPQLKAQRLRIALIHMSSSGDAAALLQRYGLGDIDQFSDPDCRLFRAFGLTRGTASQVLGPAVWLRGLPALLRHGIGQIDGDGFQLGGIFLVRDSQIVAARPLQTSADRMDYLALAKAA